MIRIDIPGRTPLEIRCLALDFNGTIAVDGELIAGLAAPLNELSRDIGIHVLTADTYGTAAAQCACLNAEIHTFPGDSAGASKEGIVRSLGPGTACMGNGYNDIPMFRAADLAIAVMLEEGMCAALLNAADMLVRSAFDGLNLLLRPHRLRAGLRG